MIVGNTARESFGPADGAKWENYILWSGLTHLREVVSLDSLLCPRLITTLTDEDWENNLADEEMLFCFRSLDYLQKRVPVCQGCNILAVVRNPTSAPGDLGDRRFEFVGYDLVDDEAGISALTNCGGFDNAFRNEDLSTLGLIEDYDNAVAINRRLRENNPDEPHAYCDLWAIWRLRSGDAAGLIS